MCFPENENATYVKNSSKFQVPSFKFSSGFRVPGSGFKGTCHAIMWGAMDKTGLKAIAAAGLLLTDSCPARCRHCYVSAGPDQSRWMSVEDAARHLAALVRLGVAGEGIHIGGGEPFGDFDRLLAVVRAAREVGLGGIAYVETSGFWAASDDLVQRRLAALAEAGMKQLSISADPYHQEFVPPDRVRRLLGTARAVLGPQGVRARRWKWLENPRDVAAMPETERLDLFREFLKKYPERMTGRAAERLAALADRRPVEDLPDAPCRAIFQSRHVHVDPEGWIWPGTCAGIARATPERPLDECLRDWRPEMNSALAILAEGGPKRLLDLAARSGFQADPQGYAGPCHLCWMVRKHLVGRGAGGETLRPACVYLTS